MSGGAQGWTRERVETRLIAAFRLMPSCPVYGLGREIRTAAAGRTALTDVLEWSALLAGDSDARIYLWTWARCKASGASFGEQVRGLGWSRSTAEDGRRRAAEAIARALNRDHEGVDTRKETPGRSGPTIATAPALPMPDEGSTHVDHRADQ